MRSEARPGLTTLPTQYASVVAKYLFARITLGTKDYAHSTTKGWIIWIGCCLSTWVFGWIVGEAVPFFGDLLNLTSAVSRALAKLAAYITDNLCVRARFLIISCVSTAEKMRRDCELWADPRVHPLS